MIEKEKKPKKVNHAKKQEAAIRESAQRIPDVLIHRLTDTMNFKKHVNQPSDFIAYRFPNIFFLEAKTTKEDKLPMANISENQFKRLLEHSKIKGVVAGIIVEYRLTEDHFRAFFVDIKDLSMIKNRQGKKYLSVEEAEQIGTEIELEKKKVNWRYNMKKFFLEI